MNIKIPIKENFTAREALTLSQALGGELKLNRNTGDLDFIQKTPMTHALKQIRFDEPGKNSHEQETA